MKTIYDELVEAGVVEISEEELDKATGGFQTPEEMREMQESIRRTMEMIDQALKDGRMPADKPYPDDFCS